MRNIIQKIEMLLDMIADGTNSYDNLKEELSLVEIEIIHQKELIQDLEQTMVMGKYLKASDRIIDENIRIGLENKIANYKEVLVDVKKSIYEISQEEENYHISIVDTVDELNQLKSLSSSLEVKLKTIGSKDKSVYSFYEDLLEKANMDMESLERKLSSIKKEYKEVQKKLATLGDKRFEYEEKVTNETLKLEETKSLLEDENSYIDEHAKEKDQELLEKYREGLNDLERRRLEIITDPVILAKDAETLLLNEENEACLEKIKELVQLIEAKPYMDYSKEELESALEELTLKRDEFALAIETKKYDGTDSSIFQDRITYLESLKIKKQQEKVELENKIKKMDIEDVRTLMDCISESKKIREQLQMEIEDYKSVMHTNADYKSPKKKASLTNAYHQKCNELAYVEEVVASYEQELSQTIIKSKGYEEHELIQLDEDILKIDEEIKALRKFLSIPRNTKDVLAIEKDKATLKALVDEVEKITLRQKYVKKPSEILDELELALKSNIMGDINEQESVDANDYRIDSLESDIEIIEVPEEKITEEVIVEEIPEIVPEMTEVEEEEELEIPEVTIPEIVPTEIEDVKTEDFDLDVNLVEPVSEENNYPPRMPIQENNLNRFKVIKIEPLEEPKQDPAIEKEETKEYMINDFEDSGYISFNDLLEGE